MELKLDEETMQGLVSKSIFDMLTPEKRDELVKGAIQSLMKRETGSGFNRLTELERLFADAAQAVARKIVVEKLEQDTVFQDGVKTLFENAWKTAFEGEAGTKLAEKMAGAFRQALTGERW
jgi:hypothetical protein